MGVQWSKIRILRILNRLGLTSSLNLDELMETDILKENLTDIKRFDQDRKTNEDLKIIKRAKIDAKKCLDKSTINIMEINVLCIGLPGVGKTSTICNMLGLDKLTLESHVTSKTVKVISGTAYNVKWNFIDTPGMEPDKFRAKFNKNILKKIIKKCKKIKPDICIYFDRMDNCRNKEIFESHLFEMIKEDFKLNIDDNIFEDLIVVLTHARSVKGLMNHKSYDELFYEITEDLKTKTEFRIHFNLVENKDHDSLFSSSTNLYGIQENDYRKKKIIYWRQHIVERLSLLTTIKKMKYAFEKQNTSKKRELPNEKEGEIPYNPENFIKSLDNERELDERVSYSWAIEEIGPISVDKKFTVKKRKEKIASTKVNDIVNFYYDTFLSSLGELFPPHPFMLDVNFNEDIFHHFRSVRCIEPEYIEKNLKINPKVDEGNLSCVIGYNKIVRPFGKLTEGIEINFLSQNIRFYNNEEKTSIECLDYKNIKMTTSLDINPVLGYHNKNPELQIQASMINEERLLVCETKIRDIEGLYDKYVIGLMYKKKYEFEMNLGLFKTNDKKNSYVKPNLCRINFKKSDDNKSFNAEGLVCIGKKNAKHNQKLYVEVEHVHLELERKIKNDTNLRTSVNIKEAEIKIKCNSSKYLTISGTTLGLFFTGLIGKEIINLKKIQKTKK